MHEDSIGMVVPSIVVRRVVELNLVEPQTATPTGESVFAILSTSIIIDVSHLLYRKDDSSKKPEGFQVSRADRALAIPLESKSLAEADAYTKLDAEHKNEIIKHMVKLNAYYSKLGELSAPVPQAENMIISEAPPASILVADDPAKIQNNIASRTDKLIKALEASEILGEVVSEPYDNIFDAIAFLAEKNINVNVDAFKDVANVFKNI